MCGSSYLASQSYTLLNCMMVILMSPGDRRGATYLNAAVIFGTYLLVKDLWSWIWTTSQSVSDGEYQEYPRPSERVEDQRSLGQIIWQRLWREGRGRQENPKGYWGWHGTFWLGCGNRDWKRSWNLASAFLTTFIDLNCKGGASTKYTINTKFLNLFHPCHANENSAVFYILKFSFIKGLKFFQI